VCGDGGSGDTPTGVGGTAIGVAAARAVESARPDRLFDDPLAGAFVAAADWRPWVLSDERQRALVATLATWVVVRTRFIDDVLLDSAADGCRQMVLLGAGLDTRAFRLDWPDGTRLFELDTAAVLDFKDRVLSEQGAEPRCERIVVRADLRENWPAALRAAGFSDAEPVAWVIEGLLAYLAAEEADGVLDATVALSAPGSRLALSHGSQATIDRWRQAGTSVPGSASAALTAMWQAGLRGDPEAWLAQRGWRATAYDSRDRAAAYGRGGDLAPPEDGGPTWLVDARR
jgi:methyltransferase (TIGR00027 family)